MKYHRIGDSGLQLTALTYGTALTIGSEVKNISLAKDMIDASWQAGIRSFDTSNNYGAGLSEKILGKTLINYPRQEYVISTKGSWQIGESPYHSGLSRKHIIWAFSESIKRLEHDYVDIYYAHRYDANVPISEIANTFNSLISRGLVRYWATSEWPLEAINNVRSYCLRNGLEPPIMDQFIYSYAVCKVDNNGLKDYCEKNGIGMLGFAPLCQGYLTGKYRFSIPEKSRIAKAEILNYSKTINFYKQYGDRIDHFLSMCNSYDVDPIAGALQWVIKMGVLPVVGASTPEQIVKNAKAIESLIPDEFWNAL